MIPGHLYTPSVFDSVFVELILYRIDFIGIDFEVK